MKFKMSNLIYHYTNNAKSIIENKEIWLTRTIQSNDSMDSKALENKIISNISDFFVDCVNKQFEQINIQPLKPISGFKPLKQVQEHLCRINNTYTDNIKRTPNNEFQNLYPWCVPFNICFTSEEKKDSRFFWDSYTNNCGFSIGFKEKLLENQIINLNKKGYYLKKENIIYTSENKKIELENMIDRNVSNLIKDSLIIDKEYIKINHEKLKKYAPILYEKHKNEISANTYLYICNALTEYVGINITLKVPFLKNEYWKEESETRLVSYNTYIQFEGRSNVFHKNSFPIEQRKSNYDNYDEIDYIKMPIDLNLIDNIIIGPCVSDVEKKEMEQLAMKNGIKISNSCGTGIFVKQM